MSTSTRIRPASASTAGLPPAAASSDARFTCSGRAVAVSTKSSRCTFPSVASTSIEPTVW